MKKKISLITLLVFSLSSCSVGSITTKNITNRDNNNYSVKNSSSEVINSNDERIKYEGKNWQPSEEINENLNIKEGESATLEFKENSISYQADKGPDKGIVDVYIDDKYHESIDLFSGENVTETVFSLEGLNEEAHKISLITTGKKNEKSEGYKINFRSIIIKNGTIRPNQTVSTLSFVSPTSPYQKIVGIATDDNGNTYTSNEHTRIFKTDANGNSTLLAGSFVEGTNDGVGAAAQFRDVIGLKFDKVSGSLYAADTSCVRKVTPNGTVTTYAGSCSVGGDVDGNVNNARFGSITNMDIDDYGNLYVNDVGNNKVKKITRNGIVSTFSGNGIKATVNGSATNSSFYSLYGMAFNSTGNLFVSDRDYSTTTTTQIRKITPCGDTTTYATTPALGMAFDGSDNLFVADSKNNMIKQIDTTGAVTDVAGDGTKGSTDGNVYSSNFNFPINLSFDNNNTLNVADIYNGKIRQVNGLTGPGPNQHMVSSIAFSPSTAPAPPISSVPSAIVFDKEGNSYVTDRYNYVVRKVTPCGVASVFAGNGTRGHVDGIGTSSSFFTPYGIDIDDNGNLYVADQYYVRKITPTGLVTTVSGSGQSNHTDGTLNTAEFRGLRGLKMDKLNNIYLTDFGTIRKVNLTSGIVSTVAGSLIGQHGHNDGPIVNPVGPIALFNPTIDDLEIDNTNNFIYVADYERIRKIDLINQVVTTVAGNTSPNTGNYSDDALGPALSARFGYITGIGLDKENNNLYIVDDAHDKIKKFNLNTNIVSHFAGGPSSFPTPNMGYIDGPALSSRFYYPLGITFDYADNIYVTDENNAIRKIKK